jgi:hypothetical protein
MITSIEPGVYRPGQWGVRIENLVLNVPADTPRARTFGEFLEFETLTLCPIDTRCIERSLLRADEIAWLNAYHATVRERLAPRVSGAALAWLMRAHSVDYSSQAPFHMGFFHEGRIVNTAAAFLQRTHPESRIALFSALSRHAFASGHDYWGWRFAGWAMHYVQDLTQPYHARVLPGLSTLRMLWINGLDIAGFPGAKNDAINLVTNRHIVVENYQLRRVNGATEKQQRDDPLLAALRDTTRDAELRVYTEAATRAVVSAESAASADALDAQLARSFPARYVDDPAQPLGNEADLLDMAQIAREARPAEQAALERQLAELLGRYGRYTRAVVRALAPAR